MGAEKNQVSELDLLAYVDNLLDEERHSELQIYLTDHPDIARKVEQWECQNETIRQLYGNATSELVPKRIDPHRIAANVRRRRLEWTRLAAVAILCFAIGGVGEWLGQKLFWPPSLVTDAVNAHNLYASEVFHPVEIPASQRDQLATWLSKRLDRAINVPDLGLAGFKLVGGRLLPAGNDPAAQFMYEELGGRRVTLYIIPRARGEETSFRYIEIGHVRAFYWLDDEIGCAMIGDLSRNELDALAHEAYKQLT